MCSDKYNYYCIWETYYRIEEGNNDTSEFELFNNHINKWIKCTVWDNPIPKSILDQMAPVQAPETPYNCPTCSNKGCRRCKPIPWSICNVFRI